LTDELAQEEKEANLLFDWIRQMLQPFEEERDYVLMDHVQGSYRYRIEAEKPELLMPATVAALKSMLIEYPNWEIMVVLGNSGGVVIRDDEIIDGLERQHLPVELQTIAYQGSRPLGSKFGDVMYDGLSISLNAGSAFGVRLPDEFDLTKFMKK
jgi:hypothetical protein